jgi:hypothetical protein
MDAAARRLNEVADAGGVVPRTTRAVFGANVDRQLVPGEHVIDEVRHVWLAFAWPVIVLVLAAGLAVWSLIQVPVGTLWVAGIVWLGLTLYGVDGFLRSWKDRFIITDSRVMRISGVWNRKAAWMPLGRVLDITVDRPLWLRPLRAGHLVLENAAQEQGLREIRLIPHPNDRALLIHALRTGVAPETPHEPVARVADHPPLHGVRRRGHHLT